MTPSGLLLIVGVIAFVTVIVFILEAQTGQFVFLSAAQRHD